MATLSTSPLDQIERPVKLYSLASVIIATVLGGPIGGCIVMALNYFRLDMRSRAWWTLLAGLASTAALIWIAFLIPDSWHLSNSAFFAVQIGGMSGAAKGCQGKLIEQHKAANGALVSKWRAAGIGLLTGIVLLAAIFGYAFAVMGPKGTRLAVGDSGIYYRGGATKENAETLGATLTKSGFIEDGHPITIGLAKDDTGFVVSFVLNDDAFTNPMIADGFRDIGVEIADGGLGKPLTIWLCDDSMTCKKTILVK